MDSDPKALVMYGFKTTRKDLAEGPFGDFGLEVQEDREGTYFIGFILAEAGFAGCGPHDSVKHLQGYTLSKRTLEIADYYKKMTGKTSTALNIQNYLVICADEEG
jgi:hypothetical protein